MRIAILGSGGREHSLAWAIAQNPKCDALFAAPGNAGMAALATCDGSIDIMDSAQVVSYVEQNNIDFVVVGPEAPLAAGVADALRDAGVLTFGPSAAAAKLEASKAFTKEICDAANAPTAAYAHFDNASEARAYVEAQGAPIVIKADGLAAGKGVVVAMTMDEALAAIDMMFDGGIGAAGAVVVIEEFMEGEEASLFVLSDGETILPVGTAQDHKRAYDGDKGPNTGGMGAYSPAPVLTPALEAKALDQIVRPTITEMAARGTPFIGVLYVGLMIKDDQPRLVEYNVRFGDPECQVLMMRMGAQVLDLLLATARGQLDTMRVNWADDHAMTVVMAAGGYPDGYAKGTPINGISSGENDPDVEVFHAGTVLRDGQVVTNGGRVLNVTARGANLAQAQAAAYERLAKISWDKAEWRTDIGWRAL